MELQRDSTHNHDTMRSRNWPAYVEEHGIHWGASIPAKSAKGSSSGASNSCGQGPGGSPTPPDYRGPVHNTHYVYPNLLCGSSCGLMEPERLAMLVDAGVDTFVCLQQHYKEYGCKHYPTAMQKLARKSSFPPRELRFLHCPVPDHGVISDESLEALVVELQSAMDQGHVVYVHCYGGHGRTGSLVSSLIMATDGVDFEAAMDKLRQCHTGRLDYRDRPCSCCALSSGRLPLLYIICCEPTRGIGTQVGAVLDSVQKDLTGYTALVLSSAMRRATPRARM